MGNIYYISVQKTAICYFIIRMSAPVFIQSNLSGFTLGHKQLRKRTLKPFQQTSFLTFTKLAGASHDLVLSFNRHLQRKHFLHNIIQFSAQA